jgi:hypothetical protein
MTQYKISAVDPAQFSAFRISEIRHDFHHHPLMQLPKLAELAKALYPTKQCRFIRPGTTQAAVFHHGDSAFDGRDIDEVFARIQEPGSWIALYNVETNPAYRGFLDEVIAAGRHLIDPEQPGTYNAQGFFFISAPPSVTPFHIDRENNLWLQIHGRKIINVWDHRDRETVSGKDVENFIVDGSLAKVGLKQENIARSSEFETTAGTGVYFPSTSPHMTRTLPASENPADNVSISAGVVFYTASTRLQANAHVANYYLRKFGLSPTYAGVSDKLDRLKYPLSQSILWAQKRFRGFKPKPGQIDRKP